MARKRVREAGASGGEREDTGFAPVSARQEAYGRGVRLRALIDSLFDAYYDWDIRTGKVDFSAQLDSFLGLEPRLLQTIEQWADRIHPEDKQATLTELEMAVATGGVFATEYRMRRADGEYSLMRDRGITIPGVDGAPSHLVGIMRDVTLEHHAERALKESADLYRTLFEQAANPAFQIDSNGRYVNANEAGARFLESTIEGLTGRSINAHWDGGTLTAIDTVLAGKKQAIDLTAEVRIGKTRKEAILTLVSCHLNGELSCFALATDITEREKMARTLEESNVALRVVLEQRDRAREELERTITFNVGSVVLPLLSRVAESVGDAPGSVLLDTAMQNLRDIVRPFSAALTSLDGQTLTRRELEIANLIRAGKSSSEIAQALYISTDTVAFHRKNLRKKLGLTAPGAPGLASFLALRPMDDRGTGTDRPRSG